MIVTGIIAEYNPFHNGHKYHIQEAKRLTGADHVIVIMSGDFVQRGAPAIYSKYLRAKTALLAGADLVLEMPVFGSSASAEDFARCGVFCPTPALPPFSASAVNPEILSFWSRVQKCSIPKQRISP